MKRLPILLLAASASTAAFAQHGGHGGDAAQPVPPAQEHAAQPQAADPHAGHDMATTPPDQADPHAGHRMPEPDSQPAADPHAGHTMPAQPPTPPVSADPHQGHDMAAQPVADPHAGHTMGTPGETHAPPVAPPPPAAFTGPDHAADGVYGAGEMAGVREELRAGHGAMPTARFTIDRLEHIARGGGDGYVWEDVQFRFGGDIDRLWIKSQGEGTFGESLESAEVQALWSRAIGPFFDLQAGVRYDFRPRPDRFHLVLGVQGLAPYWFEIDAAAFVSEKGDVTARFEGEHDARITQRLILQPRAELEFSLQDVPELGLGAGLTTAEAGLRLRYEIVPEFAPYVGVQYERAFGDTADFRRLAGEDVGGWSFVAGVRAWF